MERIAAVVLLGGAGERFGGTLPKQFARLGGVPVYLRTLERITESSLFDQIILVCPELYVDRVDREVEQLGYCCDVVAGGETRQESSYQGLLACGEEIEYVLIHDGVRPFVTKEILKENIELVKQWGAVDTCIGSTDTIVLSVDQEQIHAIPERSQCFQGQTPQTFSYREILKAHQFAQQKQFYKSTDDCRLMRDLGKKVAIAKGDPSNIKITTALDLFLAEQLLRTMPVTLERESEGYLFGKKIIVTGGTGGIGSSVKEALEEEGAIVFSLSPSSEKYPVDLCDERASQEIFEQIHREQGPVFGLVNCCGALTVKRVESLEDEEIDELIGVNFTSVVRACRHCVLERGGHIVNLSSSSYTRGRGGYSVYSAAKAAVVNFTQGLAEERGGVNVNCVVPSRTDTAMRANAFPGELKETLLEPECVAKQIVSLLKRSDLTGNIVEVKKELRHDGLEPSTLSLKVRCSTN